MSAAGIWHVSFTVADLERSVGFYVGGLGMEVVHRQEQSNEYTRRLVGYPDAHLRTAQLRLSGSVGVSNHHLELVEYLMPMRAPLWGEPASPGCTHLAFAVDDIHATRASLLGVGATFVSPPNEITAGINRGGWTCYFRDPDGVLLELVQAPPREPA